MAKRGCYDHGDRVEIVRERDGKWEIHKGTVVVLWQGEIDKWQAMSETAQSNYDSDRSYHVHVRFDDGSEHWILRHYVIHSHD